MFLSVGMLMKYKELDPIMIWDMADAMIESRKPKEAGITAIKRRVKPK